MCCSTVFKVLLLGLQFYVLVKILLFGIGTFLKKFSQIYLKSTNSEKQNFNQNIKLQTQE